jgi:hypothetical protein
MLHLERYFRMPTVYLSRSHAIQVILLIGFPLHIGSGIHYIVTI